MKLKYLESDSKIKDIDKLKSKIRNTKHSNNLKSMIIDKLNSALSCHRNYEVEDGVWRKTKCNNQNKRIWLIEKKKENYALRIVRTIE